ncbi:MAG: Persistence and stress-resistance toxin PasT [Wolbachia endosymbiont of Ctenocephalides orientis wCori]|nr:MAG: Persistence and stress-resistance toxin PasT [Wolbachia endosymbiont of Ctenocephalides orientis wCori]
MLHKYEEVGEFNCSPDQAFHIVIDVEKYPDFVPWCKAVYIKEKIDKKMIVDLMASFYGVKGSYTSEVTSLSPNEMNRSLAEPVYDEKFLGGSQVSTAEYSNVFEERNQISTTKLPSKAELCNKSNEGWIKAVSSNGIFKHLYNEWRFISLSENITMVKFYIEFEFKYESFSTLLNSMYKHTQSKIISAFKERAEKLTRQKLA